MLYRKIGNKIRQSLTSDTAEIMLINGARQVGKNLLKLYLNDTGLLSGIYFVNQIEPILNDLRSINLGTVYETVVAQELKAYGYQLFYYDNKKMVK